MKFRKYAPAAVAILGAIGSLLRYLSFTFAYEPEVELFADNIYSLLLGIISFGVVATLVAYYFIGSAAQWDDIEIKTRGGTTLMGAAAVFSIGGGVFFTIISLMGPSMLGIINGVLATVTGLAMLGLAKALPGRLNEISQILTIIPVFWGGFWLLMEYRMESANPEIELFIYRIMAIVFVILLFYLTAFCLGRNGRVNRMFAAALGCAYFTMIVVFGDMLQFTVELYFAGNFVRIGGYAYLLAMLFLSLGMMMMLSLAKDRAPSDTDGETEADDDGGHAEDLL